MRGQARRRPLLEEAWRWQRDGFDRVRAENLVAMDHGLTVPASSRTGWRIHELEALLFLRATRARWR